MMASQGCGSVAEAGSGRVLVLEDVADREWTLVSSTTADGGTVIGNDGDGAKVRDVVDKGESGYPRWADSALGSGLRSQPISTSDGRKTPSWRDRDIVAAIIDCTDTLRTLRDEKERCRACLDNNAQAITDQATASQLTMDQLIDFRSHADPMLATIEEQIVKDLGHQLKIDRQCLSQKTAALRSLSDTVRTLEADISAEEARMAGLLEMSILCTEF